MIASIARRAATGAFGRLHSMAYRSYAARVASALDTREPPARRNPRYHLTRSKVLVVEVADAVVKVALDAKAAESVAREQHALARLREGSLDAQLARIIPRSLEPVWVDSVTQPVQTRLQGVPGTAFLEPPSRLLQATLGPLVLLAQHSSRDRTLLNEEVDALIAEDEVALLHMIGSDVRRRRGLDHLISDLRAGLSGRLVRLGWVHGDLWPGNLLFATGPGLELTGIVDWDRARHGDVCLLDVINLVAYSQKLRRRRELGEELALSLADPRVGSIGEYARNYLLALGQAADNHVIRAATTLFWLRFASSNMRRYPALRADRRWTARNIDPMIS